jgi:hypothetical protein
VAGATGERLEEEATVYAAADTESIRNARRLRVICWPIVEPYLGSRNDFHLEPLLNLELLKRMVQVEGQRIGAIGLALTAQPVMAPRVVTLAPLSAPAASAPR